MSKNMASANIRLGWKKMDVANNLAYYNTVTITAVKSFIVEVLGRELHFGRCYKTYWKRKLSSDVIS
jgi:hypothetical protein